MLAPNRQGPNDGFFLRLQMRSGVRSGELAVGVTGRAAGEGEGRSASASAKRDESQNGAL